MVDWVAFSVDLEPNKDGSLDGVSEAMEWYDDVVPRGTAFVTHRVATESPAVVGDLAADHEIGVHVHPREFGHDHDQLAELDPDRQRELVQRTRSALRDVVDKPVNSFRAGRHSLSLDTLSVLADLGFETDASVNVRYRDYLPADVTDRDAPFEFDDGIVEVPTSYTVPSLLSLPGLRAFPGETVTATANTLRTDARFCSGLQAVRAVFADVDVVSMYMHPYDATDHHADPENSGHVFRERVETLLEPVDRSAFVVASDLLDGQN